MTAHVRVVLVEPREGGNVGAVARVMKNFGFDELVIVGEVPATQQYAAWWASGANDLVESARRTGDLASALEGSHLVIATTSARGRKVGKAITANGVVSARAEMGDHQLLSLVFGREDRGLTEREIMFCHRIAAIPTSPAFPTMNLAQAAGIFLYELAAAQHEAAGDDINRAPFELIDRLHHTAQQLLLDVGYLHRNNPDRIYDDLRMIVGRARLDEREATILLGIIRQVAWRVQRGRVTSEE